MAEIFELIKNDNNPVSDIDLFKAFHEAQQIYRCHQMTNVYGKTPEELMEINKGARKAEDAYMALYSQCRGRGLI